jgi:hypothetical protein
MVFKSSGIILVLVSAVALHLTRRCTMSSAGNYESPSLSMHMVCVHSVNFNKCSVSRSVPFCGA